MVSSDVKLYGKVCYEIHVQMLYIQKNLAALVFAFSFSSFHQFGNKS